LSIEVGLIGCGRWGQLILRDLVALGARVHVVAPSEATRAFATAHGAVSAVTQVGAIEAAAAGYVVATPASTHGAAIEQLIATGRPVFVEKPTSDVEARRPTGRRGRRPHLRHGQVALSPGHSGDGGDGALR
jgi:predicted dehydrogenase